MANRFYESYVETALWSSTDDIGNPLDGIDAELAPETIARFTADCDKFKDECLAIEGVEGLSDTQVAHDFWLTRNRHGAGFWNGDYPEPLATKLTDLAHSYGECDLYIGDDGKIYAV